MVRLALIWCVLLYMVFPSTLHAQNVSKISSTQLGNDIEVENLMEEGESIEGIVYEENTQMPLSGANVILIENNIGSTTNIFGKFKFEYIEPGNYTLRVSFVGFETQEINLTVSENEISRITINLQTSALELSDIIISPVNQLKSRNTISAVDIQLRPIKNSQKVLNIIPGIYTAQHAGGGKAEQIFLRGFDIDHGTDINLSLDGIPVNFVSHAHGQGYSDLHFIISETISQVDFDKGPYYSNKGNFTTAGYAAYQTMSSIKKSKITVESGQFNTFRTVALVDLLGSDKSHNAYVASEYMITDGYFNNSQDFNRINLFAKYNKKYFRK